MHTPGSGAEEARETVAWYFGDLLAEVVDERPVSRPQLVTALARVHLGAARRRRSPVDQFGAVVHRGRTETVVAIPEDRWASLADDLAEEERRAAREVHRRMAAVLPTTERTARLPVVLPE